MSRFGKIALGSVCCFVLTCCMNCIYAQGVLLRGIGAVNDSMGGTAIAAPLEATGAIYANPASISGLEENEIGFGLGVIIPHSSVTSEVVGVPSTRGTSYGDAGQIPDPTMSILYRACPHSRWTYGLAIAGVGGAVALYPAMPSAMVNPILQGQARASNVQVFEIMPTVAYKATKRLSVGFTPVLGLASLSINPLPLGMPATTPMQNYGTRYTWGGGFHLGAYYDFQNHWKTGFTFKSPLWTESMRFTGTTGVGQPHESEFGINLPMILGWGISYDGLNKTLLALDVKYFDYANTRGFRDIMDSNGKVIGLGWDSVTSVSVGMQRTLSERLKLRTGYCYNTNPTPSESQYANVSSPLFMQHVFSIGGTITLPKSIDAHLTWSHAFQNEVTGYSPTNPRVKVTNSVYADTLVFGLTKRF